MPRKKSLSETHPYLLEEWDYRKNQLLGLEPDKITHGSRKKVWWICKNEHSWEAHVFNRARKNVSGCPYCSGNKVGYGNDLLARYPELCEEWDYQKNQLGPENYMPGSKKKVWWICSKRHSHKVGISSKTRMNIGCHYCSNKKVGYGNDLLTNFSGLCKEWDYEKNKLGPDKYTPGCDKKVWWKCNKCGYSWDSQVYSRSKLKTGCPDCNYKNYVSKVSQKWLNRLLVHKREVPLLGYVVDGFDPETNTVYEFLGDYWHGNPKIFSAGKNAHNNKSFTSLYKETLKRFLHLNNKGYNIFYVWESDFKLDSLGEYFNEYKRKI